MNIAVITGASSGLGKFYVEAVAKESYDEIWIIARRKEILEQIAKDKLGLVYEDEIIFKSK